MVLLFMGLKDSNMIVINSATLGSSSFQMHKRYCKLIIQCRLGIIMQKKCEGVVVK